MKVGYAENAVIADFEDGVSDFAGTVVHDSAVAKEGKASAKIEADFSGPGDPWVTAERTLDIKNPLNALTFWAKSNDFTGLTVRLVDATGQSHQQRPTFPADGQWHQVTLSTFDSGPGYEKWGGANDGRFHWPAASLSIIAEKATLGGKTKGVVWVDHVAAEVEGELLKQVEATKVTLGDFETDTSGFTGALLRVAGGGARGGAAYGKAEADFSKPGDPWVTATKELDITNEFQALSFWVKSSDAGGLTVRMVDGTGQTHQQRPTFAADGQWHRITLRAFDRGPGYEKWGGANDGKFHWPARQLALIFEKPNLGGKDKGTWFVDDVEASVAGPARGALDDLKSVNVATFDDGADGFGGALSRDETAPKNGKAAGKIEADFSKPGDPWVTATKDLDVKNDVKAFRFWIRSSEANSVTVRLVDATGQNHQQRPTFPADGQWHQVTLSKLNGGPGYERWGGAGDGEFHPPAASISFILEKPAMGGKAAGSAWVDDVEALVDPNPLVPKAQVEQKRLGNVFLTTETVEIGFRTQADRVAWTATDFWQREVARGTAVVTDHYAAIQPGKDLRGWYALHLVAEKDGTEFARADTTFCVVTPVDVKAMPDSPFGVMTHFAQDWDTDVMPLIAKAGIGTIRDEMYWAQVERKPGQYVFREQFDKYMAEAAKLGIDPLIVMSFANPLYDDGKTPYTAEACDAYGRYGQAILERYGKQIKWLEVWNEYNGSWCEGPAAQDRPRYYAQMLKHANAKIKEVRPDVVVLGGAAVLQPLPYFEGIFKHGGLADMDAAVIHPYRSNPEGVERDTADLQELMARYNDGKARPVWATETGLIDASPGGRDRVAKYLARQYTLLLSSGVEKVYWYLCRDYNEFQTMGLLRDPKDPLGKYVPAPAYVAYANLIRQLYGTTFTRREPSDEHAYVELFHKGVEPVRVCWATVPTHVAFKADAPVTLVDMMGVEQTMAPVDGQVFLTLTDAPVFLRGAATPIDRGRFFVVPEQTVDISDPMRLRYTYDNRGNGRPVNGAIGLLGQSYPFTCAADEQVDGEVIVTGQDTSKVGSQTYWYDLTADGGVVGKGGVLVRVVDPLMVSGASLVADDRVRFSLTNESALVPYSVEAVSWDVGGASRDRAIALPLPPGKGMTFDVPVANANPYQESGLTITAKLANRSPVVWAGRVSYNPCADRAVTVDGSLDDWRDATAIDAGGRAFIGRDRHNFYLAARTRASILSIGMAAADVHRDPRDARNGWYEFRVTTDGVQAVLAPGLSAPAAVAGAVVKTRRDGDETVFEVAIPWSAVAPIQSEHGAFRLAIAAGDEAVFGDGIVRGKTPALYRVCRFVGDDVPSSPGGAPAVATVVPLDLAAGTAAGDKVIADSFQDYSNTQGRNNWSYGYYAGDGQGTGDGALPSGPYTDDDFKPMSFVETMWGYEWAEPAVQYMKLTPNGGHPGMAAKPVWVVRRWTSPIDGTLRVTGRLHRLEEQGDGVDGKVVVDGVVAWTGASAGPARPRTSDCDVVVAVKKGSFVDIAITPGPGVDLDYDVAEFPVRLTQVSDR